GGVVAPRDAKRRQCVLLHSTPLWHILSAGAATGKPTGRSARGNFHHPRRAEGLMQDERAMGERRLSTGPSEIEETASDRRKFLGTLAAGAGAATLLAGL